MPANLNWLDFVALIVIIVCLLEGFFKGFILSLFNFVGFFIAIYFAKIMAPSFAEYIFKNTGIDETLNKYIIGKVSAFNPSTVPVLKMMGSTGSQVENVLTSAIILIMAFILVFIAARVCLTLIANALDTTAKLPVLKQFNRFGGLFFGVIKGLLILYISFAVLTPVIPLLPASNPITAALDNSVFASNFYRYNFIIPWIKGKFI